MRSKQYFTSIKNNPHEISTDPKFQYATNQYLRKQLTLCLTDPYSPTEG